MSGSTQLPPVIVTGVRIRTSAIAPGGGGGGSGGPGGGETIIDEPVPSNPEAPWVPCYKLDPKTPQELEDAIRAMISKTAEYIRAAMEAYPGQEFASVLHVGADGFLRASIFVPGTHGMGAFELQGINMGSIVAMIHGHPSNLPFDPNRADWALFPSVDREVLIDGELTMVGDWLTHDYFIGQINQNGGNSSLFRQYILGWGSWDTTPPGWRLSEFDNSDRRTNQDHGSGKPVTVLPITTDWVLCP